MRGHDAFVAKGTPRNLIGCGSRKAAIAFVSPKGGNAHLSPQASVRDFRGLARAGCRSFSTGYPTPVSASWMSPLLGSLACPSRACPHTGLLPSSLFRCASIELCNARKGQLVWHAPGLPRRPRTPPETGTLRSWGSCPRPVTRERAHEAPAHGWSSTLT